MQKTQAELAWAFLFVNGNEGVINTLLINWYQYIIVLN